MSNDKNKWLLGGVGASALAGAMLWEGVAPTPYDDIAGVLTVCYGHTGSDIVRGKTYTPAECKAYLARELAAHGAGVLKCTDVPLKQEMYDALALFAYNVGTSAYCQSSLRARLNRGDYRGACDGLMDWNKARVGGQLVAVKGLTNRRTFERELCLRGVP